MRAAARRRPILWYLCEWTGESGGIEVLYDHVRLLRDLGADARLAARGRFRRARWFDHEESGTPGFDDLAQRLDPDDWLVIPEFCLREEDLLRLPCRRLTFLQNPRLVTGPLDDPRLEGVIVPSRALVGFLRGEKGYGGPLHLVRGHLDPRWLDPSPRPVPEPARVLIVDREGKHDGEPVLAHEALLRRGVAATWIRPRMHRRDFVALFGAHDVALHLAHPEGHPVSVLEAFAVGCLVVGFAGGGGLDFMEHERNCLLAPDGDWEEAVRLVLDLLERDEGEWKRLRRAAFETARRCSPDRTVEDLRRFATACGALEAPPPPEAAS